MHLSFFKLSNEKNWIFVGSEVTCTVNSMTGLRLWFSMKRKIGSVISTNLRKYLKKIKTILYRLSGKVSFVNLFYKLKFCLCVPAILQTPAICL